MPDAGAAGADDGPFPELLAGMVAANGAARGDDRAIPSKGAPRGNTPAGMETMPGLTSPVPHGEDAALVAGASTPTGKRSSAGKPAMGHAGSRERSAATSKLRRPGANGPTPDTGNWAAGQTISQVRILPVLPNAGAGHNFPAWTESVALAGGNNETTRAGTVFFPGGQAASATEALQVFCAADPHARQVPDAAGNATSFSEGDSVTPAVESIPTAGGDGPGGMVGAANQPNGRAAIAGGNAGAEGDGEPASLRQAARRPSQPEADFPMAAGSAGGKDIRLAHQPSDPPPASHRTTGQGTQAETGLAPVAPGTRKPGRPEAKADARPAGGATADPASLRVAGLELTQPAPAQPAVPPPALDMSTRNPDVAGSAGETTGRAVVPEPLDSPPAGRAPEDFSGRRPERARVLALSGQLARTTDSISSEERGAAPEGLVENVGTAEETGIRVLAASTPDRDEVAFAVRMKATPTPADGAQPGSPLKPATAEGLPVSPAAQADPAATEPAAAASGKRASLTGGPDPAPARATRERRPEATPNERAGTPAVASAGKAIPHAEPAAQERSEAAGGRPDSAADKPVRPQDAMESETRADAAKTAAVRDMKFEVTGGERRVEVRLSERAGEVKMTVRTADAPLASSLRENLPALSARLAESGFKSEAWHPAASSANEWRHDAQSAAGGASQDANAQARGQDRQPQDGAGQRRPKSPQEPMPLKEKGRNFAWLMSSLR